MIRIYVEGKELVLNRSTTMTVELNNALFASPDIEGDVSFTFTIPVNGNERLLGFPSLPQCGGVRKLPCTVYCNGIFNWNGMFVVQKASHDSLSVALVLNPYPDGFGNRSLTENEDDEIVISDSKETHDLQWSLFLSNSINNPDVKFAPFFNEEGYGSENEYYGFWYGMKRNKIVNALYFDSAGALISNTNNELFTLDDDENGGEHIEKNQLAFCPQIRIVHIIEIWCRNAGYKFINHMGEDLTNIFVQSMKSLDGSIAQYSFEGITINAKTNNIISSNGYNIDSVCRYALSEIGSENNVANNSEIMLPASGWWEVTMTPQFNHENMSTILQSNASEAYSSDDIMKIIDFGFRVAMYTGEISLQEIDTENTIQIWNPYFGLSAKTFKIYTNQVIMTNGLRIVMFCKKYYGNHNIYNKAVNLRWTITLHLISYDVVQTGFNIFRSRFNIPELLPNVSNSTFLKTILETMGLCYYVSATNKTIEIIPYVMLKGANSIDLTAYELTKEEETVTPEEKKRIFRLKPIKDESYNAKMRLEDTELQLPDAYDNHEHLIFAKKTNTLYRAEIQESSEENWVENWAEHSGNPDQLEIGSGDEEKIEPSVQIPHQRLHSSGSDHTDTDLYAGEIPQLMVADFTISSDMYNPEDKPSEILLTIYRGFREREYANTICQIIKNEVMLPVWNGEFSLTAKGANSLGEKYVKPVMELANHKTIIYKLRLPANMMQPVEDLLRPSELPPERQTRFIVIRNVKTVPKKITFQINNDRDDTVLCQIEAVKVY